MVSAQNYILRATVISRHFKTHIRIRYGVPPVKDIISRHHNAIPSVINYWHGELEQLIVLLKIRLHRLHYISNVNINMML